MQFSLRIKNEIAGVSMKRWCCNRAELAAFLYVDGKYLFGSSDVSMIELVLTNAAAARRAFVLMKKGSGLVKVGVRKQKRLLKQNLYVLCAAENDVSRDLMQSKGDISFAESDLLARRCCAKSFIRGAFLARGSVTSPERAYHLEITVDSAQTAALLQGTLKRFEFRPGVTRRKGKHVVYVKEADQIAGILSLIGAHGSVLEFENIRVLKEVCARANRMVNCETANVDKTVEAAVRQIADVRFIQNCVGLESLPGKWREVALCRLEHPCATLSELGQMLDPPLGKSGVSYRMKRLHEKAADLRRLNERPEAEQKCRKHEQTRIR